MAGVCARAHAQCRNDYFVNNIFATLVQLRYIVKISCPSHPTVSVLFSDGITLVSGE